MLVFVIVLVIGALSTDTYCQINYVNHAHATKKKKIKKFKNVYLGKFTVYSYCPTGKRTYTGTKPKQGRTIAVDPRVIPLGSTVYLKINGKMKKYIAEDIGYGINGKKIDLFKNSYNAAKKWGIKSIKVYVRKKV